MKLSIEHLPKHKKTELRKLASLIRLSCVGVEKIILYGSYARGTFKEEKDLKEDRKSGHVSDYDILVVTEDAQDALDFASWNEVEKLNLTAPVRIITIGIEELNENLANAHYLYTDIEKQGIMLFNNNKHKLSLKKKLKSFEAQRIAQDHFDHWFGKANDFVETYSFLMKKNKTASAAFHLGQIAECCYKTLLLVFTNYNPHEHHLETLGKMAERFHADLPKLFPIKNQKDRERFQLLEYAYIGGRYDPKYKVAKEDLEILGDEVVQLLKITEKACKAKIMGYRS